MVKERFKNYLRRCSVCNEFFRTTTRSKPKGGHKGLNCTPQPYHNRYGGIAMEV